MLVSCAGVSPTRIIGHTVGAAGGVLLSESLQAEQPLCAEVLRCGL